MLRALKAADGTQLWESPGPETGLIATDGSVICALELQGASQPGRLWAWRKSDGQAGGGCCPRIRASACLPCSAG